MRQSKYWLLLVVMVFFGGCVGSSDTGTPPDTVPENQPTIQEMTNELPPLPPDKAVDEVFTTELLGNQAEPRSANAIEDGTNLDLISGVNQMSWGIWHFNTMANLQNVQAVIDVPPGEEVYLAVSNYAKGSWEFDGPHNSGKTIQLNSASHKSEQQNIYVAVITYGGNTAKVYKHILNTESDWLVVTVDDTVPCESTSMAVVNGNPAIAYIDTGNRQLRYVRAVDSAGYTWGTPVFPDVSSEDQGSPSLEMVLGKPAISYSLEEDYGQWNYLYFIWALDDKGDSWGTNKEVDLYGLVGASISDTCLAIVNGRPAISYVGQNGLKYTRANDAIGVDWFATVFLANSSKADHNTSLVVDNGMPVVSFENTQMGQLKIVGATDADGTTWNPSLVVAGEMGDGANAFSSGALVNGGLSMAYFDTAANLLMFTRWDFLAEEWQHMTVDTPADIVQHTSLAVIDGNPAICFYDHASQALKYARASDNKGTSWPNLTVVDSIGITGVYSSMMELDGKPAICYTNTLGELKFAYQVGP